MTLDAYDVVVAGYGFAGAVAAIAAHDAGARVLIIEKGEDPGGISVCSSGGLRITESVEEALAYLKATNADTAPLPLLETLAAGMKTLTPFVEKLCHAAGAKLGVRSAPANYPLPGYESFGFVYVDDCVGFDPQQSYPTVRGAAAGARLFEVARRNVDIRPGIEVRLGTAVNRLVIAKGKAVGVVAGGKSYTASKGIVLACGGFENSEEMKKQWWPLKPVLSAAVRNNTGDGIRMGQAAGAGLWHMWHYHGCYGFKHPDPEYPFGIRVKRLPDWNPAIGLRENVAMSWILVDRDGRRFMNEYDPYMQDTGARSLEHFDPIRQRFSRVPALLITDSDGRDRYPLAAPTWHDRVVAERYGQLNPRQFEQAFVKEATTLHEIADRFNIDRETLDWTISRWNSACENGTDTDFGRPGASMLPIRRPPFSFAEIWPLVSNTQGGLAHDERQRVLDAFDVPIEGLFVAGELGSIFGHLYMSGGNIAECFIGGKIAGQEAAKERVS